MKTSTNMVILDGNLGRDPELKYTTSGIAVANVSLATSTESRKKSDGDWEDISQWHRVVIWGHDADRVASEGKKGDRVRVEGMLTYRKWTDNSGQERNVTEVKATMVKVWPKDGRRPKPSEAPASGGQSSSDDDIPF